MLYLFSVQLPSSVGGSISLNCKLSAVGISLTEGPFTPSGHYILFQYFDSFQELDALTHFHSIHYPI